VYDEGHGIAVLRDPSMMSRFWRFSGNRSSSNFRSSNFRSSNFRSRRKRNPGAGRPSGKGSRSGLQGQSVQKIFQRLLSGQMRRAMRPEAAFPQFDAHRLSLAANLPIPAIVIIPGSRNGDIE
jgi:hypothetical protein